jgi:hypothetical protein
MRQKLATICNESLIICNLTHSTQLKFYYWERQLHVAPQIALSDPNQCLNFSCNLQLFATRYVSRQNDFFGERLVIEYLVNTRKTCIKNQQN